MSLALLCPTLKCHIQFSRPAILSSLMCKVLVNCCDYLGALQRQLILRAEDAALQTDSNWVGGTCCSEWDAAHPSRVPTSFNPRKRNVFHLTEKRRRHGWQVDNNLISFCYKEIVAAYNWLGKRGSGVRALLCHTFFSLFLPTSISLSAHSHHTLTEEHRLQKQRLFGENSTCPQAVVSHN